MKWFLEEVLSEKHLRINVNEKTIKSFSHFSILFNTKKIITISKSFKFRSDGYLIQLISCHVSQTLWESCQIVSGIIL